MWSKFVDLISVFTLSNQNKKNLFHFCNHLSIIQPNKKVHQKDGGHKFISVYIYNLYNKLFTELFGNPAVIVRNLRPVALRPYLSVSLPLSIFFIDLILLRS
jgi:hypothetical protein